MASSKQNKLQYLKGEGDNLIKAVQDFVKKIIKAEESQTKGGGNSRFPELSGMLERVASFIGARSTELTGNQLSRPTPGQSDMTPQPLTTTPSNSATARKKASTSSTTTPVKPAERAVGAAANQLSQPTPGQSGMTPQPLTTTPSNSATARKKASPPVSIASTSRTTTPVKPAAIDGNKAAMRKVSKNVTEINKPKCKKTAYPNFMDFYYRHVVSQNRDGKLTIKSAEFKKECKEKWKTLSPKVKRRFADGAINKDRSQLVAKLFKGKSVVPIKPKKKPANKQSPAFFIFLLEFKEREENKHLKYQDIQIQAGKVWKSMTDIEKRKYKERAENQPKKNEGNRVEYMSSGGGASGGIAPKNSFAEMEEGDEEEVDEIYQQGEEEEVDEEFQQRDEEEVDAEFQQRDEEEVDEEFQQRDEEEVDEEFQQGDDEEIDEEFQQSDEEEFGEEKEQSEEDDY